MGGQGGCERRIEGFCENSKKNYFSLNFPKNFNSSGSGEGSGWWGGGAVRVDVNEELKFL